MYKITNSQLSIKELVKYLISKTLSILKNIVIDKDLSICKYTYTTQLITKDIIFQLLQNQVIIKVMKLLKAKQKALKANIIAN